MDTIDQKDGLDINFRLEVLNNVIIKKLKEYTKNSKNPDILLKVNQLAYKLEEKMFSKATSKEDYIVSILHKLHFAKSKLVDDLREPHLGNQTHTTTLAQPANTNQAQQNLDGTRSLLQQDNDLIPNEARVLQNHVFKSSITMLNRDHEFEHQNVVPYEKKYQSITEHNSMLQQPRLSNPSAISKARGKQIKDTWLRGTKRPSSSLDSQNLIGKKCKSRSQCASLNAHISADYAQSLDGEWKSLIVKFKRARLMYLPELLKLLERADTHDSQILEPVRHAKISMQQMIEFLYMPESELGHIPKDTVNRCLNQITMYFYSLGTQNITQANQALQQFSDERVNLKNMQTAPSVKPTLLKDQTLPFSSINEKGSSGIIENRQVCVNNMQTAPSVTPTLLRDQTLPFSSINEKGSLGITENRKVRVNNMQTAPLVKPTLLKDQTLPISSIKEKGSLGITENRKVRVNNIQTAPLVKPTLLKDQTLPFSSINEKGSLGITENRQVRVNNMQTAISVKPTLLKDQTLPFSSFNEKGSLGINENRQVPMSNMQNAPSVKPTLLKDQALPFSSINEKGYLGINENRQVPMSNMQNAPSVKPTLLKEQTLPFSSIKRSFLGITENRQVRVNNMQTMPSVKPTLLKDQTLPFSSTNEKGSLGITENRQVCVNNMQTMRLVKPTLLKGQTLPFSSFNEKGSFSGITENRQVRMNNMQTAPVKPTLLQDQTLPFSSINEKGSFSGITENRQVRMNNMQTAPSVKPTLLQDQTLPFSSINEKGSLVITENSQVRVNNMQTAPSVKPTLLKDQSLPSSTIAKKGSSLKITENRQVGVKSVSATAKATAKWPGQFPTQTDQNKKVESMNLISPPMTTAPAKLPDHFPDRNQKVKYMNSILLPTANAADQLPEHFLAQTNQNKKVESMNSTLLPTINANAKLFKPVSAQTDSISSFLELSDEPLETNSTSAESISPRKYQANETPCGAKTGVESDIPGTPELLASLFSLDSENNQNSHNAKHTFERLYQSVQLITNDAMWDSMDDIVSMDYAGELPAYADNGDLESAKNMELANTSNSQENCYRIDDEYTLHG